LTPRAVVFGHLQTCIARQYYFFTGILLFYRNITALQEFGYPTPLITGQQICAEYNAHVVNSALRKVVFAFPNFSLMKDRAAVTSAVDDSLVVLLTLLF